jgi:hypothetical protein
VDAKVSVEYSDSIIRAEVEYGAAYFFETLKTIYQTAWYYDPDHHYINFIIETLLYFISLYI